MLLRQHRGRHQDGHLLGIDHRFESRAHGQLRLAEPDITAQETIHRARVLHVSLDLFHDPHLVGGLLVWKRLLELLLPWSIRGVGMSLDQLAL